MTYAYDIRPSEKLPGGGWDLHLYENGEATGLIDFPATEYENTQLDAMKAAFLRAEAEAKSWMRGRRVYSKRRMRLVVHPALAAIMALVVVVAVYNVLVNIF
ncbi:MAG: hypothetical protein JWQ01_4093 [Massilia sp.]|nr:hypothetical protein [Massilia sp.]